MKNRLMLSLAVVGLLVLAVIAYLKHEFHSARRHAESAVAGTMESIRRLGALETLSLHAITNAAVAGASVQILETNPVRFRIEARTPYPDWMIYTYDSRTPERGIHHHLF